MKKRLTAIGITAAILCGAAIMFAGAPQTPVAQPVAATAPPQATQVHASNVFGGMATPKQLLVPTLAIAAPIEPVGVTQQGAMDIPDSLTAAGWYQHGAAPGNPGKAVLAAHTGYPHSPSVFRHLERITTGAPLQVRDANGATAHFEVIDIGRYPAATAPRSVIFGDSPTARLAIITCTGAFNANDNTYAERLVIYAARTK